MLVGENRVGKSNLLYALRLLLDPSLPDTGRQLREEDFWDGLARPLTEGNRITIAVDLADFEKNDEQLANLAEHLISSEPMVARLTYVFERVAGSENVNDFDFSIYGGDRPDNVVRSEIRRRLPLDLLPALRETSLNRTLQVEPALADQQVALAELSVACRDAGKLDGITLGAFSGQTGSPQHLNLITLHSAKGLEFDAVIMMGMEQGRIPSWSETTSAAKQQSRRLFYVGLTRARHEVHLTYSGWTENKYGQRYLNGPSEFLLEVKRKLAEM